MYHLLSLTITILLAPLWIPIAIYAGLTYHWTDTVPTNEDLDYE